MTKYYHKRIGNLRWCGICHQYRDVSNFHPIKHKVGRFYSGCKDCRGAYQKPYQAGYYLRHRDELLPKHLVSAKLSQARKLMKGSKGQVKPAE